MEDEKKRHDDNKITILPADYEPLKKPIQLDLERDEEWKMWIGENEDVGIRVAAYSLEKLKEEAIIMLDLMIHEYLIRDPPPRMSEKLARNVEELKKYYDPSKKDKVGEWEDGDEEDN